MVVASYSSSTFYRFREVAPAEDKDGDGDGEGVRDHFIPRLRLMRGPEGRGGRAIGKDRGSTRHLQGFATCPWWR